MTQGLTDTSVTRFGDLVGVNSTTTGKQEFSVSAVLSDGRFVIAWSDNSLSGADSDGRAIRAQIFNADGSKSGSEFLVNTTTTSDQRVPRIAPLANGKFVVTFEDTSATAGDTDGTAARAQIFNADGSKSGSEFVANTTTTSFQLVGQVATLSDGRFVIAYSDFSGTSGDSSSLAVLARVFNADGSESVPEFLVNTVTRVGQWEPAIAALPGGGFVIAYNDSSGTAPDTNEGAVRAQIFDHTGTKSGSEFLVNTTTSNLQRDPQIATLSDGRFVIVYDDLSQSADDPSAFAARGQIFNADGSKSGGEFLINTTTDRSQLAPKPVALSDGRFIVVFYDDSGQPDDPSGYAVRAQVFNSDGSKSGDEFLVNLITDQYQSINSATALGNDRILVTYTDSSQTAHDADETGIVAQFLRVGTPGQTLEGGHFGDRFIGSDGNDTFRGRHGKDSIFGNRGADTLNGNIGRDEIDGGHGADMIDGGFGNDTLFGRAGSDTIRGGRNSDEIFAGIGHDSLFGDNNEDRLFGGAGDDRLKGGSGDDVLRGGDGVDYLHGGTGRDALFGGGGGDTFVFSRKVESVAGINRDMIRDFATGDTIDIRGIDSIDGNGRNDAFTFIGTTSFSGTAGELRYRTTSTKTIVQGDIDGDGQADFEIGLSGIHALTAGDFVL